jgi:hypothetical protein
MGCDIWPLVDRYKGMPSSQIMDDIERLLDVINDIVFDYKESGDDT